jgi:uncharacterized membrane protein YoaK (UPF0700 family)
VSATYPTRSRRTALVPSLLAVIALLIGVALIEGDGFIVIRYVVSILALIVAVFSWQSRQWWWIIGLAPIAVLWNPVFPIELGQPDLWLGLQYVAAILFIACGIFIKVQDKDTAPRR